MKTLLDVFRLNRNKSSAQIAKERLQIIVAHERSRKPQDARINLQDLQIKLIGVIANHLGIPQEQVKVELAHDQDRSVLELNVTLPDRV